MFRKSVITHIGVSARKCRAFAIAAVAAFSLGVGGGAQAAEPGMSMPSPAKKGNSSPNSMEMHQAMTKGMKGMEAAPMTGNSDHDFATMMKAHHQAAVDMAEVELKEGTDPKLRSMARSIVKSQSREIKQFDDWLAKQKMPMARPGMNQK